MKYWRHVYGKSIRRKFPRPGLPGGSATTRGMALRWRPYKSTIHSVVRIEQEI